MIPRASWCDGDAPMVIGERFAWAHLPKAAGTATSRMFGVFPELIQFADPEDTNDKHTPFPDRAEMVRGRLLAMNVRRLPAWVLSRAHYVAIHGMWPDYEPIPMASHASPRISALCFGESRYIAWMRSSAPASGPDSQPMFSPATT